MTIPAEHTRFFNDLQRWTNLCLLEVTVNSELTSAICVHENEPGGTVSLSPILVFITEGMKLLGPDGTPPHTDIDGDAVDERPSTLEIGGKRQ